MSKNILFYITMIVAILGVILIVLSMYVLEFVVPAKYAGISLMGGFTFVFISFILMAIHKRMDS